MFPYDPDLFSGHTVGGKLDINEILITALQIAESWHHTVQRAGLIAAQQQRKTDV